MPEELELLVGQWRMTPGFATNATRSPRRFAAGSLSRA